MAFIAIEGIEGSGKSTQARRLVEALGESGINAILTREPGGTLLGEAIREIVLAPGARGPSPRAEALLYAADRAEHVQTVIMPALDSGNWVVCDRYSDSYRAYQGGGRLLGIEEVGPISSWASNGLEPDLVILLDLSVEEGLARIGTRPDRMESAGHEFHTRVREAFLALANSQPERFRIVDAARPPDFVAADIWQAVACMIEREQ